MSLKKRKERPDAWQQRSRFVSSPIDAESVTAAYKRWARFYDASFALVVRSVRSRLAAQVNAECVGTLLDVGVGTGVCLPLYKKDLSVTGIDCTAEMLNKARERVAEMELTNVVELAQMDASHMSFPDGSFDAVVCLHVMSVVADPVATFREVERVCKPGGRIYVANHFMCERKGARFYLERAIAPASRLLGWHPDFSKGTILGAAQSCQLIESREAGPLGLFTIMTFLKR